MALAATFDPALAEKNGTVIADEARRLKIDVVLQPFINMDRDIAFSRAYNTFGEDPLLTSVIGAAEIRGIQSRGVLAEAKHFVAYDTDGQHVFVADQPLHELYLAPFAAAVDAGVASIMCSYNNVNGPYACGNRSTLGGILRDELGFKGFVVSDWGAVHDNRGLTAGLDVEMPGRLEPTNPFAGILPSYYDNTPPPHHVPAPDFDAMHRIFEGTIPEEPSSPPVKWAEMFPVDQHFENLYDALEQGTVLQSEVDRAALRVLYEMALFGRLPGLAAPAWPGRLTDGQIDDINERTSAASAVLLKNDASALPLSKSDFEDLAVIGPGGLQVVAVGKASERSLGEPERQVSPMEALRRLGGPGAHVVGAVADDMDGRLIPAADRTDAIVPGGGERALSEIAAASGAVLAPGITARWHGRLVVSDVGAYWLCVHTLGARINVSVDGHRIGGTHALPGGLHGDVVEPNQDNLLPATDGLDNARMRVELQRGPHDVVVGAEPDGSGTPARVRLAWSTPATRRADIALAVEVAAHAHKVVLFLWSRGRPTFGLPGDQDDLVRAVTHANSHTVVVLNTSQPVALPWLKHVAAAVQMWWSGDRGGLATADILTGKVDPGGRLPFTWARSLADYPATDPAHPERSAAGVDGRTTYSEGLDIGYRWFLKTGRTPLFAFGYGLSYSRFAYSGLKVTPAADGGVDVAFRLRNVGQRAADEVPQVYLDPPASPPTGVAFATRALAAFKRLHLEAGTTRDVSLHVTRRALAYWSSQHRDWVHAPGSRPLLVGASATDIRLRGKL